ncbi:MAG: 23S rRNA (pseudouridine(1915)-N(3))-methyltransferase RlmH [Oscillospiraceae bacterium]|nr:23S rRNA (pseudouridine(1915)-N(3))-methyltransferase RlmH [Oscillospiraceae bacterium]
MLNVTLLTVGKLKEAYWRSACEEYKKRLGAFCRPNIVEVDEYRLPEKPSQAQIDAGLEAEGKKLLEQIPAGSYVITLCIEGKELSSPQLAEKLAAVSVQGYSRVFFIIGGSFGLSPAVKARSDLRLSMSPMTFPHQLARVMVLEQLYRALGINAGTKYHK